MKGRHAGQAPDIDGQVYLGGARLSAGEIRRVRSRRPATTIWSATSSTRPRGRRRRSASRSRSSAPPPEPERRVAASSTSGRAPTRADPHPATARRGAHGYFNVIVVRAAARRPVLLRDVDDVADAREDLGSQEPCSSAMVPSTRWLRASDSFRLTTTMSALGSAPPLCSSGGSVRLAPDGHRRLRRRRKRKRGARAGAQHHEDRDGERSADEPSHEATDVAHSTHEQLSVARAP